MRIAFLIALLAAAVFYSYIAFADLNFMTRTGRLGPGFFPRLIGVAAIIVTLWAILDELRRGRISSEDVEGSWLDVAVLIALAVGYAVLIRLFGGFIATFLFLAVALTILNRGQHIKNMAVAALVPAIVYLLFDRILNANMPPALFELL
ncbi:MAG TPA: tripartite tricarboxylate transporter TctB family protein [Afifellaceae bacterium]|nr:tripartite tricarboxylate transporter TctB family protein [Afifellaceae bacterium]